jgi:hypothetical protein
MSRAVFAVVMCRSRSFLSLAAHLSATCFAIAACRVTAASSTAYGGTLAQYGSSSVKPQLTRVECPTPRVSMPIRSYASETVVGRPRLTRKAPWSIPMPPGPPGLSSRMPRRLAGLVLAIFEIMMSICSPPGSR